MRFGRTIVPAMVLLGAAGAALVLRPPLAYADEEECFQDQGVASTAMAAEQLYQHNIGQDQQQLQVDQSLITSCESEPDGQCQMLYDEEAQDRADLVNDQMNYAYAQGDLNTANSAEDIDCGGGGD